MKKMLVCAIALSVSNVYAGDVIIMRHGVEFDHKAHQVEKVGMCSVCHEDQIGKIKGFGKEWAHKNCVNCHNLHNEGRPMTCAGCHKTMGALTP